MRRKVRIEHARQLAVARQRLSASRPKPVKTKDIHDLVRAIGCLQLDPTAIVARNHLLVLFSRLGSYDPRLVDALLWNERRLYEYWAHRASIVPTEDRALHAALPPPWANRYRTTEGWMTMRARSSRLILKRLAANGTIRAADFEEHAEKYESGWGLRSPISDSIALLWFQGKIVPAGREGGGRRWALANRWFPGPMPRLPAQPRAVRDAAVRSLRALGIATQKQVKNHFIRGRYYGLAAIWKDLEAEGAMVPVDLGLKGDWYVHAHDIDALEKIEAGEFEPRTTLLSPFDNLICDRERTIALWGFDFKLEIYVPQTKRWGYFVMPLLHGDRIVARFDLAGDRKAGVLNVIRERWEPGWDGRRRPGRATKLALDELASFLGVLVRRRRSSE
ncbi:MAG TPA: crosslink repair DNA glycosylase YcaQ family protein [Candidatus Dormibacteraeota bacterium]|nr:crosslink repair DNA glycosylase YcaQ family protein [Candidatus Dormibacteraeota bacterium]